MIRPFDTLVPKTELELTSLKTGLPRGVPLENFGYFPSLESTPSETDTRLRIEDADLSHSDMNNPSVAALPRQLPLHKGAFLVRC